MLSSIQQANCPLLRSQPRLSDSPGGATGGPGGGKGVWKWGGIMSSVPPVHAGARVWHIRVKRKAELRAAGDHGVMQAMV